MKTYSLFVMIHPGECEEWPCIAGIYELQLGNSHHIWVFIYAYSYINVKLGHSAIVYICQLFFLQQILYKTLCIVFIAKKIKATSTIW